MDYSKIPGIGVTLSPFELVTLTIRHGRFKHFLGRVHHNDTPFVCDGCTMWPDKTISGKDIYEACFWHDVAYFLGGSIMDRLRADVQLWKDVKRLGNVRMATVMFTGVRVAGAMFWGYRFSR